MCDQASNSRPPISDTKLEDPPLLQVLGDIERVRGSFLYLFQYSPYRVRVAAVCSGHVHTQQSLPYGLITSESGIMHSGKCVAEGD
jgi:hypothetical protein